MEYETHPYTSTEAEISFKSNKILNLKSEDQAITFCGLLNKAYTNGLTDMSDFALLSAKDVKDEMEKEAEAEFADYMDNLIMK